jgi:hypothetical protein
MDLVSRPRRKPRRDGWTAMVSANIGNIRPPGTAEFLPRDTVPGVPSVSPLRGRNGAGCRIRTRGPLITNQVLYQLS